MSSGETAETNTATLKAALLALVHTRLHVLSFETASTFTSGRERTEMLLQVMVETTVLSSCPSNATKATLSTSTFARRSVVTVWTTSTTTETTAITTQATGEACFASQKQATYEQVGRTQTQIRALRSAGTG